MKRIISFCLLLALLLSIVPVASADAAEPVVIMFGSDYQNNCYQPSYNRYYYDKTPIDEQPRTIELQAILDSVAVAGVKPDAALFVGDYTDHFQSDGDEANCAGDGIRQIKTMLQTTLDIDPSATLFTQGNHDYELAEGIADSGLQPYDEDDAFLVYVINEADFPYNQSGSSFKSIVAGTAQRLGEDLDSLVEAEETRPIMLLCHVPLHYSSRYKGKDNTYANLIFDELNEAAEDLNIFFFFGHNHSGASADYEASWGGAVNYVGRGEMLDINCEDHGDAGTNQKKLNFTYLNAGYVGYSTSATNDSKTVSVFTIYENRVRITRYDKYGEYTAAESLGQTDPRNPSEGAVTNYPITVVLQNNSEYRLLVENTTPLYGTYRLDGWHVSVEAYENFAIDSWSISPPESATVTQEGNEFYFSDLTADCTFSISFKEVICASEHFTDVDQALWYHDGIDFAIRNGMFSGISATQFDPEGVMTRAMLVTVLYRISGSPVIIVSDDYSDVPSDAWYASAVAWAKVTGIADGVGNGKFAPNVPVTREQSAAMLYRYAKYQGHEMLVEDIVENYQDGSTVSTFAVEPMNWAVTSGLISGVGNNLLSPQGSATRAQLATILMRYCLNFPRIK